MSEIADKKQNGITLGGYALVMSEHLAQKIIFLAAKEIKSDPPFPEQFECWKAVLEKHVQIPRLEGFDHANPGQIRRALENFWTKNKAVGTVLHEIWMWRNEALLSACTGWLDRQPLDEIRIFFIEMEKSKREAPDIEPPVLDEITCKFMKNIPAVGSEDEIKLGLLSVMMQNTEYRQFLDEQHHPPVVEPIPPGKTGQWEDILAAVRSIPADHTRWDVFEPFLNDLLEINVQKIAERTGWQKRQALINTLQEFGDEIKSKADYLEIEGINNWDAAQVDLNLVAAAECAILALHGLIQENIRLDNLPNPPVRKERVRLEDERRKAEEDVIAGINAVQDFFRLGGKAGIDSSPDAPVANVEEAAAPGEVQPVVVQAEQFAAVPDVSEQAQLTMNDMDSEGEEEEKIPEPALQDEIPVSSSEYKVLFAVENEEPGNDILPEEEQPAISTDEIQLEPVPEQLHSKNDGVQSASQEEFLPLSGLEQVVSFSESNQDLIRLIDQRDLSTAYWIAWAMEKQGQPSLIPSWLIAVTQTALWSIALWPDQLSNLHDNLATLVSPEQMLPEEGNKPAKWLQTVCAIYFSLIVPNQGWPKWLQQQYPTFDVPQLSELGELIADFHHKGLEFNPEVVQLITNAEETDQILMELSTHARQWLAQASSKTTRINRATLLWQELVRPGQGELYLLIEPIAANRKVKALEIHKQLEKWNDRPWLERMIQKLDQDLRARNEFSIVGEVRLHIISWILDICAVADRWSKIILRKDDLTKGNNWQHNQTHEMCNKARLLIKAARLKIGEQQDRALQPEVSAALNTANWIMEGLEAILSSNARELLAAWPRPIFSEDGLDRSTPSLIYRCLAQPLYYEYELSLNNQGLPEDDQSGQMLAVLGKETHHDAEDALHGWLEARDYRFIDRLIEQMPEQEIWVERSREAFYSDKEWLEREAIYETDGEVEQAKLESLITDQEYVEFKNRIESVQKIRRQADWETNRKVSFGALASRLETIQKVIAQHRQVRVDHLKERWSVIRYEILPLLGDDHAFYEKIKTAVENSLSNNDTRSADEYLAHLQGAIGNGRIPARSLFEGKQVVEADILFHFQDLLPGYVDLFDPSGPKISWQNAADAIRRDEPLPGIPHVSPSKNRRDEAFRAMEAWQGLKKGPDVSTEQIRRVETILSYLGFILSPDVPVRHGKSLAGIPNFQHWHVKMSAGDSSPVAEFGSQRNGEYEVIGVWQRPGIEAITSQVNALMQQTANQPAILFYFHYLTPARREQLLSAAHREGLPMLVIDEPLLLYLARSNDSRLKPMFYCTLPYAVIDPYYPFVRGRVPPEAFKGRRDLVRQLMDPAGPVIIYGGRQLGKSALLRQVELDFHQPAENRFAIYLDVKSVGDPLSGKNYQRDLCDLLAKELTGTSPKLIEERRSYDIDRLAVQLQEQVNTKNRKVILLLDEADHFLDADAEKNFYVVHKLKDLMDRTNRQFKIVLAGLYNVQRFQRMSNQPLAHFGKIQIGPLEPEPALDLLVQPLHALGYRFGSDLNKEDTSLALHILSYTNYHPGLIQLFGKHLVEHLKKKYQQPARPPLLITRTDVEAVYRTKEVREALSDRFTLTLACDPRYEAITLALILEQWDDHNGFDRQISARDLHIMAQYWWPKAFDEETITQARFTGFLDEMCSLGVLSANLDSSLYRLRSPNLVHLMGTQEQLFSRMDSLAKTTPPGKQALDSCRARLTDDSEFSPLTYAQERVLNHPYSGVALIFGSNAAGLGNLGPALQRLLPSNMGGFCEIHVAARGAEAIQLQLRNFVRDEKEANFLIAVRELSGDPDQIADEVMGAIHYCRQVQKRVLRICFTLDPEAAWQWQQIPSAKRAVIEEQIIPPISLSRWDRIGIRQRLEMESGDGGEIPATERLVTKLLDVIGGWPCLLDEYLLRCKKMAPEKALDEFKQEMAQPGNSLSRSLISNIAIYEYLPRQVIGALRDNRVRQKIKAGNPVVEVLAQEIKGQNNESIREVIEYLTRLGIVIVESHLELEPVVSRNWPNA